MPKIRCYKDSYYNDVRRVLKESGLYYPDWDSRRNLKKKMTEDRRSVVVAVVDKKIIGVIYIVQDGCASFIFKLSVLKSHRKRGIGTMLLKHAEKTLKGCGKKDVSLFIKSGNKALLNYYKKLGFKKAKTYTEMYKALR